MLQVPDAQPYADAIPSLISSVNTILLLGGLLAAVIFVVKGIHQPAKRKYILIGLTIALVTYALYAAIRYIFIGPFILVGGPV